MKANLIGFPAAHTAMTVLQSACGASILQTSTQRPKSGCRFAGNNRHPLPLYAHILEIISEVCPGSPEENHGCEPELVRSCFCALIDERRFRAGNGGNDHFDLSSGIGVRDAQLTAEFLGPLLDAPDADP